MQIFEWIVPLTIKSKINTKLSKFHFICLVHVHVDQQLHHVQNINMMNIDQNFTNVVEQRCSDEEEDPWLTLTKTLENHHSFTV